jgi:oligopeptide transport system permease protein
MDTRERPSEQATPGVMAPTTGTPEMMEMIAETTPVTGVPVTDAQKAKPPSTPFRDSLRRLRRDKRAIVSVGIIIFFVLIAIAGPPIYQRIGAPYKSTATGKIVGPGTYHTFDHQEQDRLDEGPSAQYWLGTDSLGRDLLARLLQGLLISLAVAVLVEIVDILLGLTVGVLAGYYGGWIDQVLARFTDIMFAFPGTLLVILAVGIFGPWADEHLTNVPFIGTNGNSRLLLVAAGLSFTIWHLMAR